MKRLFSAVLIVAMALSLVACGTSKEKTDYKSQKVSLKDWIEVTPISDKIVYDEVTKTDNLIVEFEVKNLSKSDNSFIGIGKPIATQNGKNLLASSLKDKNDKYLIESSRKMIESGKTERVTYGWRLKDSKADVKVEYRTYAVKAPNGKMIFKVDGRESEKHAAYAKESAKEIESKKKIKTVDLDVIKFDVPQGWYVDSTSDVNVVITKESDEIVSPKIYLLYDKTGTSKAKGYSENKVKSFAGLKSKKIKIKGRTFYLVSISERAHLLYTDGKKNMVSITVSGLELDKLKKILEQVEIN